MTATRGAGGVPGVVAEAPRRVADAEVLNRAHGLTGAAAIDDAALRRWLHALPGIDEAGADARAAALGARPVKGDAKVRALDLAIRMTDLTTLEGADTAGTVRSLCAKALRPDHADHGCPPVAAVCVYNDLVPVAVEALRRGVASGGAASHGGFSHGWTRGDMGERGRPVDAGRRVRVAAVTTAFPSGRATLPVKLADTHDAVLAGADEVDMVIDRGAFLSGRYGQVFEQILTVRAACAVGVGEGARTGMGPAHLKVILETGELGGYDNVRRASWLAMLAGADFIKTSTGKISPASTPPVALIMLEAVRDWYQTTGQVVGVKAAGGIRTAKDAIRYLVLVNETTGGDWLDPDRFRFGASSLLGDLLLQRRRLAIGAYASPRHITLAT